MKLMQTYGPLIDIAPELKEYLFISEKSFILASELAGSSSANWGCKESRILSLLMYHSLNTSLSVRLLTTFAQLNEGFALLRIRLEQLIISSFLINSKKNIGFEPFFLDINRTDYRYTEAVKNMDSSLYHQLENIFPDKFTAAKLNAVFNERKSDPSFDFESGKLKKSWSNVNKFKMCTERDEAVDQNDLIQSIKLSRLYLSLYKPASVYIHCEPGILTENFLACTDGYPSPRVALLLANLVNLAQIDLIQNYEIVKFINREKTQPLSDLYQSFSTAIKRDFSFLEEKISGK